MKNFKNIVSGLTLLFLTSSTLAHAEEAEITPPVALPQEMIDLGFSLKPILFNKTKEDPNEHKAWKLDIPANIFDTFYSARGEGKDFRAGHFTKFKYERSGDNVKVQFEDSVGEAGIIELDLAKNKAFFTEIVDSKFSDKKEATYLRLKAVREAIKFNDKKKSASDYVLGSFENNKLTIIERSGKQVIKELNLIVPEGIKITLVDENHLMLEAKNDCNFDSEFPSDQKPNTLLINFEELLSKNSNTNERHYIDANVFSDNGEGTAGNHLDGSIQDILNYYLKDCYKKELKSKEVASNGYREYKSTTGASSLLISDDKSKEIIAGDLWQTQSIRRVNGSENQLIARDPVNTYLITVDPKNKTYQAKKAE